MKKIPNVYVNKIEKNLNNNKKVFYSNVAEDSSKNVKDEKSVKQKIEEIFASNTYVYKADVEIELDDRTISTKIIGKNFQNLITINNELIPISKIKNIKNKNE